VMSAAAGQLDTADAIGAVLQQATQPHRQDGTTRPNAVGHSPRAAFEIGLPGTAWSRQRQANSRGSSSRLLCRRSSSAVSEPAR
jgi:hypothetical protein